MKNLLITINTILLIWLTIVIWFIYLDFQNQLNDLKWTSYWIWFSQGTLQSAYNQWQIQTVDLILKDSKKCEPLLVYKGQDKESLINVKCVPNYTWSVLSWAK